MAKQKKSRQKKSQTRVDFTPMVDMMMLLITFFMLCTSLAKPQTMELNMPADDKEMKDDQKNEAKASYTITIYVSADNKIHYVEGKVDANDPSCLKETNWGKEGIRKVLINHRTEDGIKPVDMILKAKKKLDEKKANDRKFSQEQYDEQLKAIKKGEIGGGQKIGTMTIVIKPTDNSSYVNVVDVLDEMQICAIGTYVIDKINDQDKQLLEKAGVKE